MPENADSSTGSGQAVGHTMLLCQVVDEAEGIANVSARELRFVFDDLATCGYELFLCFCYVFCGDFENRAQRRPGPARCRG